MIKSFIISFVVTLGFIVTAYNFNEANKSLDRCEETLQEIKDSGKKLEMMKQVYNW